MLIWFYGATAFLKKTPPVFNSPLIPLIWGGCKTCYLFGETPAPVDSKAVTGFLRCYLFKKGVTFTKN